MSDNTATLTRCTDILFDNLSRLAGRVTAGALTVMHDTVRARVAGWTAAWPGAEAEVSVTAMDSVAGEPAPRAGDALPAGAPALPAVKPLLRGWLHLICFEASLVLGTLALVHAHGAVRITAITMFKASVSAMLGTSALYHRRQLDRYVAPAPAAAGPHHDLPAHRGHGDPRLPDRRPTVSPGWPA